MNWTSESLRDFKFSVVTYITEKNYRISLKTFLSARLLMLAASTASNIFGNYRRFTNVWSIYRANWTEYPCMLNFWNYGGTIKKVSDSNQNFLVAVRKKIVNLWNFSKVSFRSKCSFEHAVSFRNTSHNFSLKVQKKNSPKMFLRTETNQFWEHQPNMFRSKSVTK